MQQEVLCKCVCSDSVGFTFLVKEESCWSTKDRSRNTPSRPTNHTARSSAVLEGKGKWNPVCNTVISLCTTDNTKQRLKLELFLLYRRLSPAAGP